MFDQRWIGPRRVALAVDAMARGTDLIVNLLGGRQWRVVFRPGLDHYQDPGRGS